MIATICLAAALCAGGGVDFQNDVRLSKHVSLHEEVISLADLSAELSQKTGVPLIAKRRVADRKVTIVFKDRPASEAMERLATCMFLSWQPASGKGYELDLTSQAAADETHNESFERELTRGGLRDAVKEIERIWNLGVQGRNVEMTKLDNEVREALKSGESPDSPHMQLLGTADSNLHMAGFYEVVGPALSTARLDDEGIPIDSLWFSSADPADPVGHIDAETIPTGTGTPPWSDAIGVVRYKEESHEIETRLFLSRGNDGTTTTSCGGWPIATSNSNRRSELEKAMSAWARPLSAEIAGKAMAAPNTEALKNEFCSGMYGRAQHLVDLADRSGVPVVADAFRRSLTKPMRLSGGTVKDWLDSYEKVSKASWKARPDTIREEKGWLMFRKDHWWWQVKSEIPEAILLPLESKAGKGHSPLSLEDYAQLATILSPLQLSSLERPDSVLLRFPVGSLGSSSYLLALYRLCDPEDRARAASQEGVDLSTASPEAQAWAYSAVLKLASEMGDISFLRSVIRGGKSVLKGFRFFIFDRNEKDIDFAKIGDGREINLSFQFGANSPHMQTFSCSKTGP